MPAATIIELTDEEREEFDRLIRSGKTTIRMRERLSIVLMADEGLTNAEIAQLSSLSVPTVSKWRKRFSERGISGIEKYLPRGLTRNVSKDAKYAELRRKIIQVTTTEKPEGETHWSTRTLAAKLGTNPMFVSRVWRDNGLKPHLVKSFKVSNDPDLKKS